MSDKPLEFHTDALIELKSAISWYLARNEIAAHKFADEIDAGIRCIRRDPKRWPNPRAKRAEISTQTLSVRYYLSREAV
jgi:plasmid stabilization system protein ParE